MTSAEKHLLQINRLQDEKESLILQVSVLTDQVEAQGEKIRDLEFTKEELQIKLEEAEQFLESVSSSFFYCCSKWFYSFWRLDILTSSLATFLAHPFIHV